MHIFVTGGTGYIGAALVSELAGAGHRVVVLSRSPEKAAWLSRLGAESHPGDLLDPASYGEAAGEAEAVIHLAFDYQAAVESDRVALETLLTATEGGTSCLVYTSGCWVVGDTAGRVWGDEAPTDDPSPLVAWRLTHEARALRVEGGPRRVAVVRPGVVYGRAGGSIARMFATAQRAGAADFIGDGSNHWSMIHVDDLARLYRVIVEQGAEGVFLAVDDAPVRVEDVAIAASEAAGAGGATRAIGLEAAREKMGPVADAMCLDQTLRAPAARALGWAPRHHSFIDAAPAAFEEWRQAAG